MQARLVSKAVASNWNPECPEKIASQSLTRRLSLGSMVCFGIELRPGRIRKRLQVHFASTSDLVRLNLAEGAGLWLRPHVSRFSLYDRYM